MFQQRPMSSAPPPGLMGISNQQNIGIATPIQPTFNGGIVDMDPITPGIQSTPGIVTPIGPSVVVSSPNNAAINSVSSSINMIGGNLNPTFEANSPFGIINGPPSIIQNEGFMAVNNTSVLNPANQFVDNVNIINPQGIQPFQPLNTFIVPQVQQTSPVYETPTFQGPIVARKNCFSMFPRWVWLFILLAILGAIIGGLFACFRPRDEHVEQDIEGSVGYDRNLNQQCKQGQFSVDGKCIRCPQNTIWNGRQCSLNQNFRSFSQNNHPPISNPSLYSNSYQPNTGNFQRVETTKSSWNSGNAQGNYADGFSAGSTTRVSKSIGQIKKVIVDPIIEDPIN